MVGSENDVEARFLRWFVLGVSVALVAARPFTFPGVGLDPSWKTGLLLARVNDIKWGTSLDYTYGPWGWLSVDTVIDRSLMALSIVFMIGVSALVVAVSWKLLRASFSERASLAIVLLVVVPVFSQVGIPDVFLAGIFGALLILVQRAQSGCSETWKTILPVTFVVALALQVKFSGGLFAVMGLVVVCALWWRTLKTVALVLGSFVAWFLLLWLISERSFSGLPDWVRRSIAIGGSYAEVQSVSIGQPLFLVLFAVFAIAIVVLLVRRLRVVPSTRTINVVSSALVAVMLYAGLKTGFIREGNARVFEAVSLLIPVWIWVAEPIRLSLRRFALLLLPVVLGIGILVGERPESGSLTGLYNWPQQASVWVEDANLFTSNVLFNRKADAARDAAQSFYGLSSDMVDSLRQSPAQIDPFDTSLIWAYGLPWRPMPIFQTYMNFTPSLDQATTDALEARSSNDTILIDTSWVGNLDYRLSLWTSPKYQLALTCSWELIHRDGRWEQWAKSVKGDRCGTPVTISSESVSAQQVLPIPQAEDGSFVVATYARNSSIGDVVSSAFALLYKPLNIFTVRLGETVYRQPRTFSHSPLIVSCPPASVETKRYEAVCPSPETIEFSESGTVTFERIPIRS